MESLIFATNNAHKLEEISAMASGLFEITGMKAAGIDCDIPETGETLQENAGIKADFIWNQLGRNCFSDDTGLEVEALDGKPGVYSARYAGEGHDFEANIIKLLNELEGVKNRKARFRTVICLIRDGKKSFFEGRVEGHIINERMGSGGFGYDSIFIPEGYDETFAQLSAGEKNAISHRRAAFSEMIKVMKK